MFRWFSSPSCIGDDGITPKELSNQLLKAAKAHGDVAADLSSVPAIAAGVAQSAGKMSATNLANGLWATAKLQAVAPEVLAAAGAIAKHIPKKVDRMQPQELSNCLWAVAKLHDESTMVLAAVPALAARIACRAEAMSASHLVTCLWASVTVQRCGTGGLDGCIGPFREHRSQDREPDHTRDYKRVLVSGKVGGHDRCSFY